MKTSQRIVFAFVLFLCFSLPLFAQQESAVYSLDKIEEALQAFNQKYLAYQSAIAHGSKMRKCEKRRQDMMDQLDKTRYAIADVPYYKGDKSLHESTTSYVKLITNVLNENYAKVVNLEDIAEQSYDGMEQYILLKKQIDEKMQQAGEANHKQVVAYCAKYNITLNETDDSKNGQKMRKVGEVMDYEDKLYLIFFKCAVQDNNIVEAMNKKNVTAIEQLKSAMLKYADEGLAKLDTTPSFEGDASMKDACKKALLFFKSEADKISNITDYYIKEETFNQVKKNFEGNAKAQGDKAEIAKYNTAVSDMNKASQTYNQTNQALNNGRNEVYKNRSEAVKNFMDTHVPYAK